MRSSELVLPHDGPSPDIVVAFAFDTDSIQALRSAIGLARKHANARVHVVCVPPVEPRAGAALFGHLGGPEHFLVRLLSRNGSPRVVTHLRGGELLLAAARVARELDAALLLYGRGCAREQVTDALHAMLGLEYGGRVVVVDGQHAQ